MKIKSGLFVIGIFLSLCLLTAFSACTQNEITCAPRDAIIKEPFMNPEKQIIASFPPLPAMDINTPPVFETASFGLG
jgi:hypothetical protein